MNININNEKEAQTLPTLDITEDREHSVTEKFVLKFKLGCNKVKAFSRTKKGKRFWLVISFLFGGIPGLLLCYFLVEKKSENFNDGDLIIEKQYKLYKDKDFRGLAQESIRLIKTTVRGQALLDLIKTTMKNELEEKNIPAKVFDARIRSGGVFNGEILPMIVIENPEPKNKYFQIGIIVNEDSVVFPLLGESKENTKNNRSAYYKNENTLSGDLKSALYSANQFKLQREVSWRQDVLACFNENLE